jgi:esterase/lipase superfamily enzyme
MGGMLMRGIAVLLAYVVGLGAVLSVGIIGVMALHSSTKSMLSAQPVAAVSQKERIAKPAKQAATVPQKEAQPAQKRKVAQATRKRKKEEAPTFSHGFNAYGYAQEPRRFYQYPAQFFGR